MCFIHYTGHQEFQTKNYGYSQKLLITDDFQISNIQQKNSCPAELDFNSIISINKKIMVNYTCM